MSSLQSGSQSQISSQTETMTSQFRVSATQIPNHLECKSSITVTSGDTSSDKPLKIVKSANSVPSSSTTHTPNNKSCGFLSPPQIGTDWDRRKPAETSVVINSDESNSRNFGKKVGWRPSTAITERWNAEVHPRILQVVRDPDSHEFITRKSGECQSPCAYHLWIVSGRPTIVIVCANKKIAKATKVVIKNNPLFRDQYPEFALLLWTEANFKLLTGTSTPDSQSQASLSLCGMRVIVTSTPIDEKAPWNQATIGGVLKLKGSYFGITVAHPFFCGATRQARSLHQGLMAKKERLEAENEESRLEDILERGKLESDSEESELEKDFEEFKATKSTLKSRIIKAVSASLFEGPEDKPLASVVFQSRSSRFRTVTGTENDPDTTISVNAPGSLENLALVGFLPGSGHQVGVISTRDHFSNKNQYVGRDLDWALIHIADPRYWVPNKFMSLSGSAFCPKNVAYYPPTGRVLITSQCNGPRETYCTGLKSSILIPGATAMQEVWSIETPCYVGDCGTWVLDLSTGNLIGILIASSHMLNITYIMPAWRVFEDINRKCNDGMGRSSDLLSDDLVPHIPSDSSISQLDGMIGSDDLDLPIAVARDTDEPLDYTFHPGNKSTYEQHNSPSASELGTEQIPTSTDIKRESNPVQVDSPAPGRAHKISPPTLPPQKRRKTSAEGHDQIVQQLLEKGVDLDAKGGLYSNFYGNELQAASVEGRGQIIQELLDEGADVNVQGGYYGNALQAASAMARGQIVQQLLKKGAKVNAQGGYYGNALQAASAAGNRQIVQQLLEEGADVNAQGGYYGNALQAASAMGHRQIVQQLLEKGANINVQGGHYGNVLQTALAKGHGQIVLELLRTEVNIREQGRYLGNTLQASSAEGLGQIVQQPLKGMDVKAQGRYYGNTLQAAKGKVLVYFCCNCGHGPSRWEINPSCQNCYRRQCGHCIREYVTGSQLD